MEQGNATHSGKLWENIQSRKENMKYSWTTKTGLEWSGVGILQAQSYDHPTPWSVQVWVLWGWISTDPQHLSQHRTLSAIWDYHPHPTGRSSDESFMQHLYIWGKFPIWDDYFQYFLGDEVWLDHGTRCTLLNKIIPCPKHGQSLTSFFPSWKVRLISRHHLSSTSERGSWGSWQGRCNFQWPHTDKLLCSFVGSYLIITLDRTYGLVMRLQFIACWDTQQKTEWTEGKGW